MGIAHQPVLPHWQYFLALEEDVARTSRWIEFEEANLKVYSIELARLLMTAAAEADVIAKLLCRNIDKKAKAETIGGYRTVLLAAVPDLIGAQVVLPAHGMTLTPWANWKVDKADLHPEWWTANNKVKHHRDMHFSRATLKNVLNATSGLLLLLLLYYSKEVTHVGMPKHFRPLAFANLEGAPDWSALRLLVQDGVPWGMP
jgi:hypothetical protein